MPTSAVQLYQRFQRFGKAAVTRDAFRHLIGYRQYCPPPKIGHFRPLVVTREQNHRRIVWHLTTHAGQLQVPQARHALFHMLQSNFETAMGWCN